MSASNTGPSPARQTLKPLPAARMDFLGVLQSEWIKITTVRSTIWAFLIVVALQIAFGVMLVLSTTGGEGAPDGIGAEGVTSAATLGVLFNQLVVSVLGVLVIGGEYGTGQIRSSLTAVPRRLPVLWAKALVFAFATFAVGLGAVFASFAVTWPILNSQGTASDPLDSSVWGSLVGAAGYLALVGLIAYFIGAMIRNSAGGIAAAVALLLVIPPLLTFLATDWAIAIGQWMPASVGQALFVSGTTFSPWQAVLILLGWVVAVAIPAAILLTMRDA